MFEVPSYKRLTPPDGAVIHYATLADAPTLLPQLVRQVSKPENLTQAHIANLKRVRASRLMPSGITAFMWCASTNPAYRDASITTTDFGGGVRNIVLRGGYATSTALPAVCFASTTARVILFLPEAGTQTVFNPANAMVFVLVDGARRATDSLVGMVELYMSHLRCVTSAQLSEATDDAHHPNASDVARWTADVAASVEAHNARTAAQLERLVAHYDSELERLRDALSASMASCLEAEQRAAQLQDALARATERNARLEAELFMYKATKKSPVHSAVTRLTESLEAEQAARAAERQLILNAVSTINSNKTGVYEYDED